MGITKNVLRKNLKKLFERNKINHWAALLSFLTLKEAFAYSKAELSGPQYGVSLQKWITIKFGWDRPDPKLLKGDIVTKKSAFELKVSLGTKTYNKFNFVQVRLQHTVDFYVLIAYYVTEANLAKLGEIFIFKLTKKEIVHFVGKSYSHGTTSSWAATSAETIKTYSEKDVRVSFGSKKWVNLLKFRISQQAFSNL